MPAGEHGAGVVDFELNSGHRIPAVGLGTWKSKGDDVRRAVESALNVGYKHIDTAAVYGNEEEIGKAIGSALKGGLRREDLFITSKLWSTDLEPEQVQGGLESTLRRLQLSYLDLYLIHVPVPLRGGAPFPATDRDVNASVDLNATWREMEKLVDMGLVRSIGISNYTVRKLQHLMASSPRITPAVNQVELHPYWRQERLVEECRKLRIHVSAYSPLGSADRPRGLAEARVPKLVLLDNDVVAGVGNRLRKSPAQVVLRWGIESGHSVLPKSTNPERIAQNLDVLSWSVPQEDFKALSSLEPQVRILDFQDQWVGEGKPVRTVEQMWDGEV